MGNNWKSQVFIETQRALALGDVEIEQAETTAQSGDVGVGL